MARPFISDIDLSDDESSTISQTDTSELRANGLFTRTRNRLSTGDINIYTDGGGGDRDDGQNKTRRVNPQRLAGRLAPDLVAEMEAHIVPGAKMPNFTVRKDLQERYNVDRRHIYDYFHSRGLRVAKEDKHTNLVRGRTLKAQQALQAQTTSPQTSTETPTVIPPEKSKIPKQVVRPPSPAQPERRAVVNVQKKPRIKSAPRPQPYPKRAPVTAIAVPEVVPSRSPSPCPEFTMSNDHESPLSGSDDELWGAGDFCDIHGSGDYDMPLVPLEDDYPAVQPQHRDVFVSIDERRGLTQEERMEIYNSISSSIGPASGIQESVGTYRKYMKERTRAYFDKLILSRSRKPTRVYQARSQGLDWHLENTRLKFSVIPDLPDWISAVETRDLQSPTAVSSERIPPRPVACDTANISSPDIVGRLSRDASPFSRLPPDLKRKHTEGLSSNSHQLLPVATNSEESGQQLLSAASDYLQPISVVNSPTITAFENDVAQSSQNLASSLATSGTPSKISGVEASLGTADWPRMNHNHMHPSRRRAFSAGGGI